MKTNKSAIKTIEMLEIIERPKEFDIISMLTKALALSLLIHAHDINRNKGITKPRISGVKQQAMAAVDLFLLRIIFLDMGFECKESWYFDRDRACFSSTKSRKIKNINTADN